MNGSGWWCGGGRKDSFTWNLDPVIIDRISGSHERHPGLHACWDQAGGSKKILIRSRGERKLSGFGSS